MSPVTIFLVLSMFPLGCTKAEEPVLTYLVARPELDLRRTEWTTPDEDVPVDTLSILNLGEQAILVTPIRLEGEGAEMVQWRDFLDFTEVRAGDSVSVPVTLVPERQAWSTGSWTVQLEAVIGAVWNDPSDFDLELVWFEDQVVVPVTFELDCDLDDDGLDAVACGGPDEADVAPVEDTAAPSATGDTSTSSPTDTGDTGDTGAA